MEEPRHPVSGIDYPGTFQEFDKWFSSENAYLDYIAKLRWPMGVTNHFGRGFSLCGL